MKINFQIIANEVNGMRLTEDEVKPFVSRAIDEIMTQTNNMMMTDKYYIGTEVTFGSIDSGGNELLTMTRADAEPWDGLYSGMSIKIHNSKYHNDVLVIKDVIDSVITFETEELSFPEDATISFYVIGLPIAINKNISDIIDILNEDMKESSGMRMVTLGVDSFTTKQGSQIRDYINQSFLKYVKQPNREIELFKALIVDPLEEEEA